MGHHSQIRKGLIGENLSRMLLHLYIYSSPQEDNSYKLCVLHDSDTPAH